MPIGPTVETSPAFAGGGASSTWTSSREGTGVAVLGTSVPAGRSASATCVPGPTALRPTARIERFIHTVLRGWADSAQRAAALPGWLDFHNWRRPHGALAHTRPELGLPS